MWEGLWRKGVEEVLQGGRGGGANKSAAAVEGEQSSGGFVLYLVHGRGRGRFVGVPRGPLLARRGGPVLALGLVSRRSSLLALHVGGVARRTVLETEGSDRMDKETHKWRREGRGPERLAVTGFRLSAERVSGSKPNVYFHYSSAEYQSLTCSVITT